MITDGNIPNIPEDTNELRDELISLLNEDWANRAETIARRKRIRLLGSTLLKRRDILFVGEPNKYYIGPDVDNEKIIYEAGINANLPITQMSTDGKRTRLRKPRVRRQAQPRVTDI